MTVPVQQLWTGPLNYLHQPGGYLMAACRQRHRISAPIARYVRPSRSSLFLLNVPANHIIVNRSRPLKTAKWDHMSLATFSPDQAVDWAGDDEISHFKIASFPLSMTSKAEQNQLLTQETSSF